MKAKPRLGPAWWPLLLLGSPVIAPLLALEYRRFLRRKQEAAERNRRRLDRVLKWALPELEFFELTALVEQAALPGFGTAAGVSYWLKTDRGALLFDIAFGDREGVLEANAARLGFNLNAVDALAISHLHPDHMGGLEAVRRRSVAIPAALGDPGGKPCYLPDQAAAPGFDSRLTDEPRLLEGGLATTGPLASGHFFTGLCEEQALVARVKGKGLVVLTGCGHPTIATILQCVRRMSDAPLYALIGGLHFPITGSRNRLAGVALQTFIGTGKTPWQPIDDNDLTAAIAVINEQQPAKVWLSSHDSCDHALARFRRELHAETIVVLEAGKTYRL